MAAELPESFTIDRGHSNPRFIKPEDMAPVLADGDELSLYDLADISDDQYGCLQALERIEEVLFELGVKTE
jgi:hypothetical protein